MRIPLDWLKEFVPVRWPAQDLAHRLTMAGLETAVVGGDLEVAVTPNRGDCLSVLGIAREVSALQGRVLSFKKTTAPKGGEAIKKCLKVQVQDRKGCPRYMARLIRGVAIKPSPAWMQKRLEAVGIRPVNNVVDCTNYLLAELGHPHHAFDSRFLRGDTIVVRREKAGTKFKTLDGETRECEPADLFICDEQGPVALAGILGGANSEVRPDTKDIVLEAAFFDPQRIHATAKRLKISTESSYRFERGVDPNGVENALHRVCQLIMQTAGGLPSRDWIDLYPNKIRPKQINLPAAEVKRILGLPIAPAQIKKILKSLGIAGTIPTWRSDLTRPIDLIEETARIYGYDKIPESRPRITVGLQEKPKGRGLYQAAARCLTGLGFTEGCHLGFVGEREVGDKGVALSNPLSADQTHLRDSLVPGLVKSALFNANRQVQSLKLFEWGKVFRWENGKVKEDRCLGLLAFGNEWPSQWQIKPKPVDFFTLKGALTRLFQAWGLEPFETEAQSQGEAVVLWQGVSIGRIDFLNLEVPMYVCEISLEKIIKNYQTQPAIFKPISPFPFVERDLALVVDSALPAQKIGEAIRQAGPPWLETFRVFDLYKGEGIEAGKKSIAFSLRYASKDRTLTNEEVNRAHEALTAHLEKTLPAKLR
ncbi:MAG: phenylalanine--tRNA ligase subunit beta [Deltaproteobacteria bacterium]|nr:phenylalanine--tRNA ligase subunit beta [Deltaproteobacteria bacterium]